MSSSTANRCDEPAGSVQAAFDAVEHAPDWNELDSEMQAEMYQKMMDDNKLAELIDIRDRLNSASQEFGGDGNRAQIDEQLFTVFGSLDDTIHNYIISVWRESAPSTGQNPCR